MMHFCSMVLQPLRAGGSVSSAKLSAGVLKAKEGAGYFCRYLAACMQHQQKDEKLEQFFRIDRRRTLFHAF
jgi:hypothetical protein